MADITPTANALETTLGLVTTFLVDPGHLTWLKVVEKMSLNPAHTLGLRQKGTLSPGADADVTIIDPTVRWRVDGARFRSKSRNTPLQGRELMGRASMVIVGGCVKYQLAE